MRDKNTFTQPKISCSVRDTFSHVKRENYEISRDLEESWKRNKIDASEHISDRLHKTAQLMRKPRYSINKSQSNLSDVSCTSSSVKLSDQIANPSCKHTTCMEYHT